MSDRPDGWVAVHDKGGADLSTVARYEELCLMRWKERHAQAFLSPHQLAESRQAHGMTSRYAEAAWEYAQRQGWRIRPIAVVFLD